MGSLFSSPKKPEPLDVAATTAAANKQNTENAFRAASFNRVNQTDALGNSLKYSQSGTDAQGNPIMEANQQLGETGQMYANGLAGLGQQYMATAGQGAPDSNGAFDRAYEYASANLEPRMQRARDAQYNQLRNQGLDPTSEAYKSSMNDLALQQNEARNNLVTGLQGQMFNQGLQGRQQQMSELQPGMQFGQQAMTPSYVNPAQVNLGNVDVAGLTQAANADKWKGYQADVSQKNAMIGGIAAIGGSLLAAPMTGGMSLGGALGGAAMKGVSGMFQPAPQVGPWQTSTSYGG